MAVSRESFVQRMTCLGGWGGTSMAEWYNVRQGSTAPSDTPGAETLAPVG